MKEGKLRKITVVVVVVVVVGRIVKLVDLFYLQLLEIELENLFDLVSLPLEHSSVTFFHYFRVWFCCVRSNELNYCYREFLYLEFLVICCAVMVK